MQAGGRDANGNLIAGTEVMHLVAHKGRLYASTSLWMEKDPAVPKACQVLALDSPKGRWRVEHQFTTNNLRYGSLRTVTFSTDANGKGIGPVELLLAAPDVAHGPVEIFCRDDETGKWVPSTLGTAAAYETTRAIGLHRDSVTGIDRVFAGTNKLGVIGGVYDPAAAGRIRWEAAPELQTPPDERVMGFCDCGGTFYCATSRHIFRRADGKAPSWKEVYFCERETSPCGIRGLSAVPNPAGGGEVLLFAALSKVHRLDPDGNKETVELGIPMFLTRKLGVGFNFALSAYNEFMPYTIPGTSEKVWLFGFESTYLPSVVEANQQAKPRVLEKDAPARKAYFAAEGRYLIRHAKGTDISYEMAEVVDPNLPTLVAVRTIAVSPFPEDRGRALYFGGFDCNKVLSHNTAWIYRGVLAEDRAKESK